MILQKPATILHQKDPFAGTKKNTDYKVTQFPSLQKPKPTTYQMIIQKIRSPDMFHLKDQISDDWLGPGCFYHGGIG